MLLLEVGGRLRCALRQLLERVDQVARHPGSHGGDEGDQADQHDDDRQPARHHPVHEVDGRVDQQGDDGAGDDPTHGAVGLDEGVTHDERGHHRGHEQERRRWRQPRPLARGRGAWRDRRPPSNRNPGTRASPWIRVRRCHHHSVQDDAARHSVSTPRNWRGRRRASASTGARSCGSCSPCSPRSPCWRSPQHHPHADDDRHRRHHRPRPRPDRRFHRPALAPAAGFRRSAIVALAILGLGGLLVVVLGAAGGRRGAQVLRPTPRDTRRTGDAAADRRRAPDNHIADRAQEWLRELPRGLHRRAGRRAHQRPPQWHRQRADRRRHHARRADRRRGPAGAGSSAAVAATPGAGRPGRWRDVPHARALLRRLDYRWSS